MMRHSIDVLKKLDAYLHLHERLIYESNSFKESITLKDKENAIINIYKSLEERNLLQYLSETELSMMKTPISSNANQKFLNLVPFVNVASNLLIWTLKLNDKVDTGLYSLNKWKKRFKFGTDFDHNQFVKRNSLHLLDEESIKIKYQYYKIIYETQKSLKGKGYSDKKRIKTYNKLMKKYGKEALEQIGFKVNEKGFIYYYPAHFFNGSYSVNLYNESMFCKEILDFVLELD